MPAQIIFNADDFGRSGELNSRVIELHKKGIIKSAGMLANGEAFEHAVAIAKENPSLDIGAHINLTEGKSLTGGPKALVDKNGQFKKDYFSILKILFGLVNKEEMKKEIETQIRKVVEAGINPSHIDGHQHVIVFPAVWKIIKKIMGQYGIKKVRISYERFSLKEAVGIKDYKAIINYLGILPFAFLLRKYATTKLFFGILRMGNITKKYLDYIANKAAKKNCPIELAVHLQFDKDLKTLREFSTEMLEKRGISAIGYKDLQ